MRWRRGCDEPCETGARGVSRFDEAVLRESIRRCGRDARPIDNPSLGRILLPRERQ
jgi:hypothetical protein